MKKITTISLTAFALVATQALSFGGIAQAATLTCTNLYSDLKYGDTNATTGNQVTPLQNFLSAAGYLYAAPNGNFGPGTQTALKSFQAAKGITQTGQAGPLTRAAIQSKSCTTSTSNTASAINAVTNGGTTIIGGTTATPVAAPIVVSSGPNIAVSAPAPGEKVTEGSTYTITWDTPMTANYNIVLEDQYGVGAGFIASYLSGGTSYAWNVGKVSSNNSNGTITISPGTYRIRVTAVSGISNADKLSALFTIAGQPLAINSVLPGSVANDNIGSVILYGTGFDSSSRVYFDTLYGPAANLLYTTADGKGLIFSVPNSIAPGSHTIYVTNSTGSQVTSTIVVTASGAAQ